MSKAIYSTALNEKEDLKVKESAKWLKDSNILKQTNKYAVTKYALMQLADRVEKFKKSEYSQ